LNGDSNKTRNVTLASRKVGHVPKVIAEKIKDAES
jgi:hypothetical protein